MNERIKALRKEFGMNQTEFGERIGVKQTTIAGYENGSRQPLDTVISSICKEFKVNEEWLRTGVGDKTKKLDKEEEIAELTADLFKDDKSLKSRLIFALAKLEEEDLAALLRIATALVDSQKEND